MKREIQKLCKEKYNNFVRRNTKALKGEIREKINTFAEQLAVVAPLAPPDIENSLSMIFITLKMVMVMLTTMRRRR